MTERSDADRESAERTRRTPRKPPQPGGNPTNGEQAAGPSGRQVSDSVTNEHQPSANQVRHEPIRASRDDSRRQAAEVRSEETASPKPEDSDEESPADAG